MSKITKDIEVNVPVTTAYNQWTQFESFPQFMDGVKEVRQLDDRHMTWRAEIAGKEETWEAEIVEQVADQRIAWRSITGAPNAGVVDFHHLSENSCNISLTMDYEPHGLTENIGSALGFDDRQIEGDLKRFKEFVEKRGAETGAYRGETPGGASRL